MSHDLWQLAAGQPLPTQQIQQLHQFIDLLLEANQHLNLTRIRSRHDAEYSHIADALTLLRHIPAQMPRRAFAKMPGKLRIADIGSGGGVPGIILAICRPEAHITLIEATGKKAAFLKSVCQELKLNNAQVLPVRAEDAALTLRDTQNIVTARAVAELAFLVEWAMPLLKIGGKLLAMKGPKHAQEIPIAKQALAMSGGGAPIIHPSHLPPSISPTLPTPTTPLPTDQPSSDQPSSPPPPQQSDATITQALGAEALAVDPLAADVSSPDAPSVDAVSPPVPSPTGHVILEVKKNRPSHPKLPRQPSVAKSKPL